MSQFLNPTFILGNQTTRKTLESTYVAGNVSSAFKCRNASQLILDIEYTMGAAETSNSIQIKVEFANPMVNASPASTDWYQEASESISAGTGTVSLYEHSFAAVSSAATYDRFQLAIPICSKFYRVSIKETGVASNKGSASVKATLREDESIN